ncbi:MPN527 family putative ECF transporter permease subunit [Mycoplasma crocodyli]|uniref:Uncharacterized protein n=1 Tax=Mycoplasma crocodyli (strain ATCC 51981 / MP145) TaxID=512564 RepID=D5E536_MYCCM|nr:hypothetical protein [Mycoplasma crocodyli]ADE19561.1 conserved hypothetical protein [Mycoplasma crocodyli MP145]
MGLKFNKSAENITIKITLTGFLLGLTLLFNYLGTFMSFFGTFLKFDLSLIFVFATFAFVGRWYGICVLLLRFILGPLMSASVSAVTPDKWLGHFILLTNHVIYIICFFTFYSLFKKQFIKNQVNNELINDQESKTLHLSKKQFYLRLSIVLLISIFITSLIITTLSTFIFNPIYFWILNKLGYIPVALESPSYLSLIKVYDPKLKIFFFYISNYTLGSYALFIPFNLLNLTINSIIISIILFTDYKTKIFSKYKRSNQNIY